MSFSRKVHTVTETDLLQLLGYDDPTAEPDVRIVQLHHRPDGTELTVVVYTEEPT